MNNTLEILEVGMRDGLQNINTNLKIKDRIALVKGLISAGIKNIQLASFVNPKRIPQMACAEELIREAPLKTGVHYSGLVFNQEGVDRALSSGIKKIETSISVSETYNKMNLGMDIPKAKENLNNIISMAESNNLKIRAGLQCVWGCYYDGIVSQKIIFKMLSDIVDMGVKNISLCDTLGQAKPRDISNLLKKVQKHFQGIQIYMHLHNSHGQGLKNLIASLQFKIKGIDTSLGGIGGSPFIKGSKGNIATEDAVNYLHNNGISTGIDTRKVDQTVKKLENIIGSSHFTAQKYQNN